MSGKQYANCPHCGKLVDKEYAVKFNGEFYCSAFENYQWNITISHKTGRRVGNSQTGVVTHARIGASWKAMCGTEPGKRGGWTSYPEYYWDLETAQAQAELVTCPKCRNRLKEL